jgi:hypothetical protein
VADVTVEDCLQCIDHPQAALDPKHECFYLKATLDGPGAPNTTSDFYCFLGDPATPPGPLFDKEGGERKKILNWGGNKFTLYPGEKKGIFDVLVGKNETEVQKRNAVYVFRCSEGEKILLDPKTDSEKDHDDYTNLHFLDISQPHFIKGRYQNTKHPFDGLVGRCVFEQGRNKYYTFRDTVEARGENPKKTFIGKTEYFNAKPITPDGKYRWVLFEWSYCKQKLKISYYLSAAPPFDLGEDFFTKEFLKNPYGETPIKDPTVNPGPFEDTPPGWPTGW